MITRHIFCTLLAGLGTLTFIGCSPKKDKPTSAATGNAVDGAADSARDVADRTGDALASAWDDVKDATYDERAKVRASLDNLAMSIDAKINELQARSASASASSKETWNRGFDQLRAAQTDLQKEIKDLGEATAETWDRAKAEVATAWERVRQTYADVEAKRTTS